MRYLQVTGIDGADLQLVDADGEQFALTVTDQVLSSVDSLRGDDRAGVGSRPSVRKVDTESATDAVPSTPPICDIPALPPGELVTPRTVQELLRAGHSAPQVAAAADWELAKVERYAAPIEAERSYIAGLVQDLPVGATSGESARTVGDRIEARLQDRGVNATSVEWDAYRRAGHGWVVVCRFNAGGRSREASWDFRATTRSLTPIDDEARWLGEDERGTGGPIPTPVRPVKVFDVEAEGGVTEAAEPTDLVSAMQARSRDRRARSKRGSATRHHQEALTGVGQVASLPADVSDLDGADDGGHTDQPGTETPDTGVSPKPTVDELGHDPVTGTVDLFRAVPISADSAEHSNEDSDEDSDEDNTDQQADAPPLLKTSEPESVQNSADDPDTGPSSDAESPSEDSQRDQDYAHEEDSSGDEHSTHGQESGQHGSDSSAQAEKEDSDPEEGGGSATGVQAVEDSPADLDERPSPPSSPGGSRSGRPSVPSWDDIMFGGRRGRD